MAKHLFILISDPQKRVVFYALIWLVVFMLMVEAVFRLFLPEAQFSRFMAVRAREMMDTPPALIQIYGDSVADGALNEKVLAQSTGIPMEQILNASLPSSSALFAAAQLKRQVAARAAPRILILAYNPRSYSVPMVPKFMAHYATLEELIPLAMQIKPPLDIWLRGLLDRTSKTMRYQENLNSLARTGKGIELFQPEITPTVSFKMRRAELPGTEDELSLDSSKGQALDRIAFLYNGPFKRSDEIHRSLHLLLDMASAYDIQVWLVSMPKPPATQALHDRNGFNASYTQMIEELEKHPALTILQKEQMTLPASDFIDGVHLTRRAGIQFSEKIGRRIQQYQTNASLLPAR